MRAIPVNTQAMAKIEPPRDASALAAPILATAAVRLGLFTPVWGHGNAPRHDRSFAMCFEKGDALATAEGAGFKMFWARHRQEDPRKAPKTIPSYLRAH
jgi:hypothetical protein